MSGNPLTSPATATALRRIDRGLSEARLRMPARWERQSVVFDRRSAPYRPALALAEWILERSSPELGTRESVRPFETFLIQMHSVFETYVAWSLSKALNAFGLSTKPQDAEPVDLDSSLFQTVPDMVVTGRNAWRPVILDTKYKPFDESYRPAEADIYQMVMYCATRGSTRGILVYPERVANQAHRTYQIRRTGIAIDLFPLPLGAGVDALETSIAQLATFVASPGPLPQWSTAESDSPL